MDFFDLILQLNYIDRGIKCVYAPEWVLDVLWYSAIRSPRTARRIEFFGVEFHEWRYPKMVIIRKHREGVTSVNDFRIEPTQIFVEILVDAVRDIQRMA